MPELLYAIITLLGTVLTGGGILFHRQNKQLKEADGRVRQAEAKAIEISNEANAHQEWIDLYNQKKNELDDIKTELRNAIDRNKELYADIKKLNNDVRAYEIKETKYESVITYLKMCRCVVQDCPHRKPPVPYGQVIDADEERYKELINNLNEEETPDNSK